MSESVDDLNTTKVEDPIDEEQIECGICFELNTLEDLICCKGSICEDCLNKMRVNDPNPICPFCRQNIDRENYNRVESDIKLVKAVNDNSALQEWLEQQSRATPGVSIHEAIRIYKYIKTMRSNVDVPPNFDYLFIGYFRSISDLWDDVDKMTEFNRLVEFSRSLGNYQPFYQVLPAKSNTTRLFPDRKVELKQTNISINKRGSIVTKPDIKPGSIPIAKPPAKKKLPPPLPGSKGMKSIKSSTSSLPKPKPVPPSSVRKVPLRKPLLKRTLKEKKEDSDYSESDE